MKIKKAALKVLFKAVFSHRGDFKLSLRKKFII